MRKHFLLQAILRKPTRVFQFGGHLSLLPGAGVGDSFADTTIRITPNIQLWNHLPFEIAVAVSDDQSQSGFMRTIMSNECQVLSAANTSHSLSLAVEIPQLGFARCKMAQFNVPGKQADRSTSILVGNNEGEDVELLISYELRNGLAPEIVHISCPLVLSNETPDRVFVKRVSSFPLLAAQAREICLMPLSDRRHFLLQEKDLSDKFVVRTEGVRSFCHL